MHPTDQTSAAIEALRPVLDTALDAVVAMARDGAIVAWNAAAEQVFGWSAAEAIGRPMADLIIPHQYRQAHCEGLARYNSGGEERVLNRRIEISALHKDGRELPVELSITLAGPGEDALFLGFLRDISERRAAETRLERQARETQLLFDVTRMAAETDSFEEALRACLEAIGDLAAWPVGHALILAKGGEPELVSTDVWYEAQAGIAAGLREATARLRFTAGVGLPGIVLASGEPAWISDTEVHSQFLRKGLGFAAAFGFPIKSEGRILAVLEFFSRTTAHPDAGLMLTVRTLGEQVGRVIERRRRETHLQLLVNELNHRVKNTLTIVQSIAVQTLRGSETGERAQRALESRLSALAAAHDLLTTERWESASLRQVIEKATGACGGSSARLRVEGPDVRLQPRTAVTVAMAVHELCTNAVKYGALSNEDGTVDIHWKVESGERLHLVWSETGGPPVTRPERRGFGTRLIERALAADLGGNATIEFRPGGIVCTLDAPLPRPDA